MRQKVRPDAGVFFVVAEWSIAEVYRRNNTEQEKERRVKMNVDASKVGRRSAIVATQDIVTSVNNLSVLPLLIRIKGAVEVCNADVWSKLSDVRRYGTERRNAVNLSTADLSSIDRNASVSSLAFGFLSACCKCFDFQRRAWTLRRHMLNMQTSKTFELHTSVFK